MDPYSRRVWRSTRWALIVSAVVILLTALVHYIRDVW